MLTAAERAEAAADRNALMFTRITETAGQAHVFTTSLAELTAWRTALGGHTTRLPAGPGVCMWTLHTDTNHGNGTPIFVHAPALAHELAPAELTAA
ncbi:hypothetical protein ACFW9D_05795 [Streptomyces sp. NPDC059524]|uniref:hypothetical protein n=1 Tax=Streptomyces sp. NPDC059524 TaxID=3346856 RepID=UPI0036BF368E